MNARGLSVREDLTGKKVISQKPARSEGASRGIARKNILGKKTANAKKLYSFCIAA